ncbi:MAG: hypothetical protein WB992_17675, partial [Bryobacteraceae bacterium]
RADLRSKCLRLRLGLGWPERARSQTYFARGVAFGFLMPAIVTLHALYFHWAHALEMAFGTGLVHIAGLLTQTSPK